MLANHVAVELAGRVLPDGSEVPASSVYGLDGLAVTWGRSSVWDQPDVESVTIDVVLGPPPWPPWVAGELLTVGMPVTVTGSVGAAPAAGAVVFRGTVTDVAIAWDTGWPSPRASVAAIGTGRQAESDVVGSAPFPAASAAARAAALESLAMTSTGQWVGSRSDLSGVLMAAQDVDAQPWAELVRDIAVAADGVAWPVWGADPDASHAPGAGYLVELIASRPYVVTWHPTGGGTATIVGTRQGPVGTSFTDLSACWAERAGPVWARAADTMVTRVSVSWVEAPPVGSEDGPVEHTETVIDPDREASLGVQGASVATLLTSAAAAQAMAAVMLQRSSAQAWRLEGVTLDAAELADAEDGEAFTRVLTHLAREGLPVALNDLGAWAPVEGGRTLAFLEGGTLAFTGGRWTAELTISSIGGTGVPVKWQDLPAAIPWTWQRIDPSVRWVDVGVPAEV